MTRRYDPEGKVALFSHRRHQTALMIECSGCGGITDVGWADLVRLALPFYLVNPLRYHHAWIRCPGCNERRWIRIRPAG